MRRPTRVKALILGVAAALALAACSDPTNPTTGGGTGTAGGGSDAATSSASSAGGSDSATGSAGSAGGSDSATGNATGESAPGSSGASGSESTGATSSGNEAPTGNAAANATGTVNIFLYQKTTGIFGPINAPGGAEGIIMSAMNEGLMIATPDGKLEPQIAEAAPTVSADATTVTYKIKKGLKWSDGQPLTAKDVLFTYTRAADSRTTSNFASYMTNVAGVQDYVDGKAKAISGLTAPDDTTFVVKSTVPDSGLVGRISTIGVFPEHALKDKPIKDFAKDPWFQKPVVTSGPFTFVENKVDQFIHVTANPMYRASVGVKDIYFKPLKADVATQQLSTGELDIAQISPADAETVAGFGNVDVQEVKSFGFVRAAWNQEQPRFSDPKVKQAFLYAIDRKGLLEAALQGHGAVRNDVWDPLWSGDAIEKYDYNPDKAKQLLQEANWDSSKAVKLTWVPGSNPDRDAAATVLQDQLNKVGIKLELNQVETSWFADAYKTHNFDMVLYGGGDYASEPSNVGPITNCKSFIPDGPNTGIYCNKDVDAKIAEAAKESDATARAALYQQAAKVENADPSQLWLYSPNTLFGVTKKLTGFKAGNSFILYHPNEWKKTG